MNTNNAPKRWFLPLSASLLAVLIVAWVTNAAHLRSLERGLSALANEKLAEFEQEGAADATPPRMGAEVVASKPYVFWGSPSGKVSVYVEHRGDGGNNAIEGYEFFFAQNPSGEWVQTESGRCTSAQCTIDGKKLLDALDAKF